MTKIKNILKSQTGQGIWEYLIILAGVAVLGYAVSTAFKTGMVGSGGEDTGSTGKVVNKINKIIDDTTKD